MRSFKLILAYDGTNFTGWQRQPRRRTVQGVLEKTLLEKKQEALDRSLDRFEAKEDALRKTAAERGRNRIKRLIRKIDPSMSKLKYDPQDIKVILPFLDCFEAAGFSAGSWPRTVTKRKTNARGCDITAIRGERRLAMPQLSTEEC